MKIKLKDLFILAKIVKKLDITMDKMPEDINKMSHNQLAMLAFDVILDGINNSEDDVYEFIASVTGKTKDEVANFTIEELQNFVSAVIRENDIKQLFTNAKALMVKK